MAVRRRPRVHEVRVVTKAEAYERAKAAVKDVPGSLEVLAETPGDALKLADEFAELPGAEAADVLPCFAVPNPVVPPVR